MAELVYALCALTSAGCALLLFRAHRSSGVGLLFWRALCFVGLALNNLLLFADLVLIRDADLSVWRKLPAVAGVLALLYSLVFETE